MFKLESYITPLLLSYVDKYIKNLKPEDSQVSLWGGDAVFNNLDLRLDVLEQELKLPFTFVNGHIHELRIHVPWTKLGSESVVITINTIECVVKLHDAADDGSSTKSSSGSIKVREHKRALKNLEIETAAPPSYIQNLLNRVVNNITVVCNNVILKYVEEDIVLSLNVKSLHATSANEKWEHAFVDLSLSMPILRKLIHLHDLTVCLDRMNSSGKIDTYQDPLLYHCSLDCRVYVAFDNQSCKKVSITRANILCEELDFSITDQQLPMFVRLLELCLALYYNDLATTESAVNPVPTVTEESLQVAVEGLGEDGGWSSWMWSYVWPGDDISEETVSTEANMSAIWHFGLYIARFMFTFKVADAFEKNVHIGPTRFSFTPVAKLYNNGVFLDMTLRGVDFVNVQMGIDQVHISSVCDCVCGVRHNDNISEDSLGQEVQEQIFFKIGTKKLIADDFMKDSLFDPSASENQNRRREYFFEWDRHFTELPDSKLLDRADAISFDYFYVVDLPHDWADKSSVSVSDLEYSNLHERTEARVWVGPLEIDVKSNVVHCLQWIIHASKQHDYTPYSSSHDELAEENAVTPTEDEIRALESFIPFKTFNFSFIRPAITIHLPDHRALDFTQSGALNRTKKSKSRSRRSLKSPKKQPMCGHSIVIFAEFIDAKLTLPKYPRRVAKTACLIPTPSESLLHHSYSYATIKVMGCAADINGFHVGNPVLPSSLLKSCNFTLNHRAILCPTLWKNSNQVENENLFQIDQIHVRSSVHDLWIVVRIVTAWLQLNANVCCICCSSDCYNLEGNALNTRINSQLELIVSDASLKTCCTEKLTALRGSVGRLSFNHVAEDGVVFPILNGPENSLVTLEELRKPSNLSFNATQEISNKLIVTTIQFSRNLTFNSEVQTVMACTVEKFAVVYATDTIKSICDQTSWVLSHLTKSAAFAEGDLSCESFSKGTDPSSQIVSNTESLNKCQSSSTGLQKPPLSEKSQFADYVTMLQSPLTCYSILKNLAVQICIEGFSVILPNCNICVNSENVGIKEKIQKQYSDGFLTEALVINCPRLKLVTSSKQDITGSCSNIPVGSLNLSEALPWIFNMENFSVFSVHANGDLISCVDKWKASATVALNATSRAKTDPDAKQLNLCVHFDLQQLQLHCADVQMKLVSRLAYDIAESVQRLLETLLPLKDGNKMMFNSQNIVTKAVNAEVTLAHDAKETISLWMQITVPRVVLEFVGTSVKQDVRLLIEMEDVSSSIDIQDVYSKVNLKIATLNATHFIRSDGEWKSGPYEGVTLCCRERLSKLLYIPNAENEYVELMARSNSLDEQSSDGHDTANNNFFNLTLTSAQSRNAHKRWMKMMEKCESGGAKYLKFQPQMRTAVRYISEVDVKITPFDFVLWPPLIHFLNSILDPVRATSHSLSSIFTRGHDPDHFDHASSRNWQKFGCDLPLFYASCRSIRIFLPVNEKLEFCERSFWTRKEDVTVLGLGGIQINSQVENPLPRTLLEQDIYDVAHQAGILNIPGSDVEDRQYQMDITTISISTGVWRDIALNAANKFATSDNGIGKLKTMGENPAFEWNAISTNESASCPRMNVLTPFVHPFDVRVAFAPAMICRGLDSPEKDHVLVAGHSLEVNVSTDIVVNINVGQLPLFLEILSQLQLNNEGQQLAGMVTSEYTPVVRKVKQESAYWKEPRDSGVDSEGSTLPMQTISGFETSTYLLEDPSKTPNGKDMTLPCFEIFLTARRMSMSAYVVTQDGNMGNKETVSDEELRKTLVVHPLIHTIISQPHLFLHCYHQKQKLEFCWYDFSFCGSTEKLPLIGECYLPNMEDFPIPWIETRPGRANIKTGIPPALITATLTDFSSPGVVLKLERPIKFNFSLDFESNLNFITSVISNVSLFGDSAQQELTEHADSRILVIRRTVTKMSKVDFATGQILFDYSTCVSENPTKWIVSCEEINGSFSFKKDAENKDLASDITGRLCADGLAIKLIYRNTQKYLLKHSAFTLNTDIVWDSWCQNSEFPRVMFKLATGALFVHLDEDSVKCCAELCEKMSPSSDSSHMVSDDMKASSTKMKKILENKCETWHDDLRVGVFQYIQGLDDGDGIPKPLEIVFCKHKSQNMAGMSWRYPQPRAITKVEINPVPFRIPADDDTNDVICCELQYWDALVEDFTVYRKFYLSESANCSLDLPPVSCDTYRDLVIAHTWRVIMDFNSDDEAERKVPFVSPLALAACLRVDSYFNPALVASVEILTTLELFHVTVSLQVSRQKKPHWHQLQDFDADDMCAANQEILFLNIENICVGFYNWHQWNKINVNFSLQIEILEYSCLTKQILVESFHLKILALVGNSSMAELTRKNMEVTVDMSAVTIHASQSAVHTLSLAIAKWKQDEDDDHNLVLNYYFICNNTTETLRFGQDNTEENIVLLSGKMHYYSWRSFSKVKELRVSAISTDWNWCDPFGIDNEGNFVRIATSDEKTSSFHISIKRLSTNQKEIVISGQLCFTNRLLHPIGINMKYQTNEKNVESPQFSQFCLEKMSTGRTFITDPSCIESIQVAIKEEGVCSRDFEIPLKCGGNHNVLIQLPSTQSAPYLEVWCNVIVRGEGKQIQLLVAVTPMYVVKVHFPFPLMMSTRGEKSGESRVLIRGRGCEHHIDIVGDGTVNRTICFQLNENFEASKPAIVLSSSLLSQMDSCEDTADFLSLCSVNECDSQYLWPYSDDDLENFLQEYTSADVSSIIKSMSEMKPVNLQDTVNILEQPKVDLEVFLKQRWSGCNTVCIDIKPWGLLVNQTGVDMVLRYLTDEWRISAGSTLSPPKLKEPFKLGIYYCNEWHYSESIELDLNDWSSYRYKPRVQGILSQGGCMQCEIEVSIDSKVCMLSLEHKLKNGMTILVVKPSYFVVNNSSQSLVFRPIAALRDPEMASALNVPDVSDANEIFEECTAGNVSAILLWNLVTSVRLRIEITGMSCFLCVGLQRNCIGHSLPCELLSADVVNCKPSLHQAVVPLVNERAATADDEHASGSLALRVICCPHQGSVFVVIRDDVAPQFQLHNNCTFELYFGQGVGRNVDDSLTVQEELGLLHGVPILPPHSSRHYTFPSVLQKFPGIPDNQMPMLHFSGKFPSENSLPTLWSNGVSVSSEHELFLNIPNVSDVKVRMRRHGAVMNIYIDPVSRVEVSAQEIRSRIKSPTHSAYEYTAQRKVHDEAQTPKNYSSHARKLQHDDTTTVSSLDLYITTNVAKICLVLLDENCVRGTREVLRLTAENLHVMYRPLSKGQDPERRRKTILRPQSKEQIVVCIGSLQLDNQLQFSGNYNFPVVLVRQDRDSDMADQLKEDTRTWHSMVTKSMLVVNLTCLLDQDSNTRCLQEVVINLQPVSAYVEDGLLYELNTLIPSYLPVVPLTKSVLRSWVGLVPLKVKLVVEPMEFPVLMQRLRIEPVRMLLSVHASMKLFLSLDSTPLNFNAFECCLNQTTVYQLGQIVTTHYLAGALIRAGWVIGSLDMLANPAGLVRAVGSGISDLVKLPYYGLLQGPFAFLAGCLFGSSSLMKQISAGALTSVTNLASSVSRNMDRLSLDNLHRERNEELRRRPPGGLAAGIGQGLTSLGFGVLGAVAGLVEHPLQNIQLAVSQTRSAGSVAQGLASGVGKGLIGVVAKPIGGAAEFVSQTGQGLLYGVGWNMKLKQLNEPSVDDVQNRPYSLMMYACKILHGCPAANEIFAVDVTCITHLGTFLPTVLLLSSQGLFVVNLEDDSQQQAYNVAEWDLCRRTDDPTLLRLVPHSKDSFPGSQGEDGNRDRISEFIMKSCSYTVHEEAGHAIQPRPNSQSREMLFFTSPRLRTVFLALYSAAQDRAFHRGFCE